MLYIRIGRIDRLEDLPWLWARIQHSFHHQQESMVLTPWSKIRNKKKSKLFLFISQAGRRLTYSTSWTSRTCFLLLAQFHEAPTRPVVVGTTGTQEISKLKLSPFPKTTLKMRLLTTKIRWEWCGDVAVVNGPVVALTKSQLRIRSIPPPAKNWILNTHGLPRWRSDLGCELILQNKEVARGN